MLRGRLPWFAVGPNNFAALAPAFILAGVGIGCAETAEHAAVANLAPTTLSGSAFGMLAAIQAGGNLAASDNRRHPVDRRLPHRSVHLSLRHDDDIRTPPHPQQGLEGLQH